MKNIQSLEHDCVSEKDEGCKPEWRPDSCWSWLVCAASAMSVLIVTGIGYSFGLMLPPLMDNFDGTRQATGNTVIYHKPIRPRFFGPAITGGNLNDTFKSFPLSLAKWPWDNDGDL